MSLTLEPHIVLNDGGYPVAPLTTPEMVRFNDGSKLTSYIQNNNLLDNSYFIRPVNQRGLTTKYGFGTNAGYFIDRWMILGVPQIPTSGVATITTEGIRLSAGSVFEQILEYPVEEPVVCSLGIVSGSASAYYYPSNKTFSIQNDSNTDDCVIAWAKLEKGMNKTRYVYKGYALEFLECMRYCIEIPQNRGFFGGVSSNSSVAYGIFNLVVPMRITPSIERNANSIWIRTTTGSRSGTGTHAIYELRPNCVTLTLPFSGTAQVDSPVECFVESSIILSADL